MDHINTASTQAHDHRIRNFASKVGRFILHLLEMLLAMEVGMAILHLLGNLIPASSSYAAAFESGTNLHALAPEVPPRCPHCGSYLRPDVVWFGETLPPQALRAAFEAAQQCDLFFSIGTSGLVQPVASLPYEALRRGVTVVEINPDETPLTPRVT